MAIQNIRIKFVTDDSDLAKSDKALDKLTASEKQLQKEFDNANKSAKQSFKTIEDGAKKADSNFNNLNNTVKNIGVGILAAFALDSITSFGSKVIELTSIVQKYEAVLTNTFGSKQEAQASLALLTEEAIRSNFSLNELTEGYIKLVNQGFKPTTKELRGLQDLSNFTAKSFDQLIEAVLDAQQDQFIRLKDFGIKAAKEGEIVKFTFREQTTAVENTASAIRGYLVGLGQLSDVQGTTAAISGTLSGRLSNLGDNFDKLFVSIGTLSSGPLNSLIDGFNFAVDAVTRLIKGAEQIRKESGLSEIGKAAEDVALSVSSASQSYQDFGDSAEVANKKAQKIVRETLVQSVDASTKILDSIKNRFKTATKLSEEEAETLRREGKAIQQNIDLDEARIRALDKLIAKKTKSAELSQEDIDKLYKKELANLNLQEQNALREGKLINDSKVYLLDIENTFNDKKKALFRKFNQQNLEELKSFQIREREIVKETQDARDENNTEAALKKLENKKVEIVKETGIKIQDENLKVVQANIDAYYRELEAYKKAQEEKKAFAKKVALTIYEGFKDIGNTYAENLRIENQTLLSESETNRKTELARFEGNKQAQSTINAKYDAQERKLKREQAIRDRDQTLFNIGIATAQAVVSALGSIPFTPANIALSAIVGGLGAIQLGLVASRPLPKYARGVEMLTGAGTETSDSIHAMLSKGERVVPADTNKDYYPTLTAIHNRHIPPELLNNMVMNYDRIGAKHDVIINDNSGQTSELKSINKKLDNLKQVNINIDKNGIHAFAETQFSKKEHVNNYLTL